MAYRLGGRTMTPTTIARTNGRKPSQLNRQEATYDAPRDLTPPKGLRGEGLAEWNDQAPRLVRARVVTAADLRCLEDYCRTLTDLRAMERLVRRVGLELSVKKGYQGAVVRLRQQVLMQRLQLGLTPSSRASLAVPQAEEATAEREAPTAKYLAVVGKG